MGGRGAVACAARFDELVAALDELDGSAAFVHPEAMAAVAASGKRAERAAMATVETLVSTTIRARDVQPADLRTDDLFGRIVGHWDEVEEPDRTTGIARDVILVHLASMSNLFAASGWMLGHLVLHPAIVDRVRGGDDGLLERCALESTRHRAALGDAAGRPAADDGARRAHHLPGGARRADRDPAAADQHDRAARPRPLRPRSLGPAPARERTRRCRRRELVTTFGHGEHTCPAQPFSLAAMCRAAGRLLERYDVAPAPGFTAIVPLAVQIGGVARSQHPCEIRYRAR